MQAWEASYCTPIQQDASFTSILAKNTHSQQPTQSEMLFQINSLLTFVYGLQEPGVSEKQTSTSRQMALDRPGRTLVALEQNRSSSMS